MMLVHIPNVLETLEIHSFLKVECLVSVEVGAYAATRSVFVLSLVRHNGQLVQTRISMACG